MKHMTGLCVRNQLIFGLALLCLVLAGPTVAGEADSTNRNQNGFTVAGVTLGMDFESVLKIYPMAKIEREAANCYSYGRAISVPALTRRILRHSDTEGILTLNFEPPRVGGRLFRIHYDRPVNLPAPGVRKLLDRLSMRYGPYDRILYRRKMEPAGRIVGFEWQSADGATLRVVLRNEYGNGSDSIRLSFLARSTVQVSRPTWRALSLLCGRP